MCSETKKEPRQFNFGECSKNGCETITHDVNEYCAHCVDIYCFEHLEDEWCENCSLSLCTDPGDGNAVHL